MPDEYLGALQALSDRVRRLESQVTLTPVRYTVSGAGYLINSLVVGAQTATLSTIPVWASASTLIIVIDPGTVECEVRRLTSLADTVCTFSTPLAYAHAENDPVLLISDPVLYATWFGALGDGVANDTIALNRAMVQAGIITPAVVYLTGTQYRISSSILVPPTGGISIKGYTRGYPEIYAITEFDDALIRATMTGIFPVIGLTIENISFNCNLAYYGIEFSAYEQVTIRDCKFTGTDRDGIFMNGAPGNSNSIFISGCSFGDVILRHGIHILGAGNIAGVVITGNTFENCGSYSVYGEDAARIVIAGNVSVIGGPSSWNLTACTNYTIAANED